MNAGQLWQTFWETGSPEVYLLYNYARKQGREDVSEGTGTCASCNGLQ